MNSNVEPWLDNYYDFMQEELLIRVESLKIELDEIHNNLSKRIDNEKIKAKEDVMKMKNKVDENIESAKDFVKLFDSSKQNKTEKVIFLCEEKLHSIDELESDLSRTIRSVTFNPNENKLPESFAGSITITTLADYKNPKS